MEDTSLLGLDVRSLAFPHNRKGQFEACLFLLWEIKWYLCTHAHVYACSVCKCMQKHPQCLVWQSPEVCLYFCGVFPPQWGLFLCISDSYILVFFSWNETYSPKEIKTRKEIWEE